MKKLKLNSISTRELIGHIKEYRHLFPAGSKLRLYLRFESKVNRMVMWAVPDDENGNPAWHYALGLCSFVNRPERKSQYSEVEELRSSYLKTIAEHWEA